MMGIFDRLGKQPTAQPQQQMTPAQQQAMQQEVGRIKADPTAYLRGKGFNIPDGMTDPRQITQYLLQSRQVQMPRRR